VGRRLLARGLAQGQWCPPTTEPLVTIRGGTHGASFISPRGEEDLKAQLDLLIERLRWPSEAERQSWLRGLAELAAFEAGSRLPQGATGAHDLPCGGVLPIVESKTR
jgi:hypothetical protein